MHTINAFGCDGTIVFCQTEKKNVKQEYRFVACYIKLSCVYTIILQIYICNIYLCMCIYM